MFARLRREHKVRFFPAAPGLRPGAAGGADSENHGSEQ
jgi:hypothetical protein